VRSGGMIHFFSDIPGVSARVPWRGAPVRSTTTSITLRYRAFVPGSLNCEAMVPKTGRLSSVASHALRLRRSCLRTSRSASREPRLSNLLMAMTSAKSIMSIFSSCVAAPYSAVIT